MVQPYDVSVVVRHLAAEPRLRRRHPGDRRGAADLLGDYHLSACPGSPACNLGAASKAVPSYQQPAANARRRRWTSTTRCARRSAASTPAPTRSAARRRPAPRRRTLYFSTFGQHQPDRRGRHRRRRRRLPLGRDRVHRVTVDVSATPYAAARPAANVDGLDRIDDTHFYAVVQRHVTIPVPGRTWPSDEDVVYYNDGTWSLFFDGSATGWAAHGPRRDQRRRQHAVLLHRQHRRCPRARAGPATTPTSTAGTAARTPGSVDASAIGLVATANVDGSSGSTPTHFYLSFSTTTRPFPGARRGPGRGRRPHDGGTWSTYFDGTAQRPDRRQPRRGRLRCPVTAPIDRIRTPMGRQRPCRATRGDRPRKLHFEPT